MSTSWQVETADGDRLDVMEADGLVVIEFGQDGYRRLNAEQAEDFARLFTAACWEAGRNSGHPATPEQQLATDEALAALRRKLAGDDGV
jgi:hypothetical protein